jgi:glucose-1-phosphate thymidylyltransferase
MKAVIPTAGLGTRLRPHTLSRPKPLVVVAGKPVLGHVLDRLSALPIDEMIFITGYLGEQIEAYVNATYPFKTRFVEQKELKGQAHAIHLAREFIDEPFLIVFVDTIFEADLSMLEGLQTDGAIFVKEVKDPRRFGVAVVEDGVVTRLVEKPKEPVSNLAVVGVYYLKNWRLFNQCLDELIERGIKTLGEFYLADALQLMIERGATLSAFPVDVWEDTGTPEALLETNRYLLQKNCIELAGEMRDSKIIPPVDAAPGCTIVNSIVGPNVSIASGAVVQNSIIRDSIVGEGAQVTGAVLADSIIGNYALIEWHPRRLNVSDYSQIEQA